MIGIPIFYFSGKCSYYSFNYWLEVFYWEMVSCSGMFRNSALYFFFFYCLLLMKIILAYVHKAVNYLLGIILYLIYFYIWIQAEGDYNAKLGITILGNFLMRISFFVLFHFLCKRWISLFNNIWIKCKYSLTQVKLCPSKMKL